MPIRRFYLSDYIARARGDIVNCYDQAYGLSLLGRCIGIDSSVVFLEPFGYINQTDLVGVCACNNPFFVKGGVAVQSKQRDSDDVYRSIFGNHRYVLLDGVVFDACAGPALGTQTQAQYLSATVDTSTHDEEFLVLYQNIQEFSGKKAGDANNAAIDNFHIPLQ